MRGRAGLVFAALALTGVAALAVFPVQAWQQQRHERHQLATRLAKLSAENAALRDRAATLQTDAEIERLARDYNLVKPGEESYFILPRPDAAPETDAPADPPSADAASTDAPPPHRSHSLWSRLTSLL